MSEVTAAPPKRRRRTLLVVVLVVVGLLVLAAVWVGVRAFLAKGELDAVVPLAGEVKTAAAAHDLATVSAAAKELSAHADRAAGLSSDPVWRAAEVLPWIGPNLGAVRVASAQLDAVGNDVVLPLVAVAEKARTATPGRLDVSALSSAEKPLAEAATTMAAARKELDALDTGALVSPLSRGVTQLREVVRTADDTIAPLAQAASVLPSLLGADGPRTLLLIIQNNAELRTGGGITGTFLEIRTDAGKVSMGGIADSTQFPSRDTPIIAVPQPLTTLYGDVVGRFVQDASIPADFGLTGRLAAAWWESHAGTKPDAVISIDPIVLQALLAATGPVPLPDGSQLSADNLVQRLLVDPYMTMSSQQQTVFFAQATAAMFARLFTQGMDPLQWVQALTQPVEDGRVSIWSSDPAEQKTLEKTALGGPAARQRLAGADAFAVYLNDNDGGKMATYLKTSISSGTSICRADGRRTVAVDVSVTSTAPRDAGSLPISMTGGGLYGVGAGDIGLIISVSAPKDAYFGGVSLAGKLLPSANVVDGGYVVSAAHVNLQPGETNVVRFRFVVDHAMTPKIVHTPLLSGPELISADPSCE